MLLHSTPIKHNLLYKVFIGGIEIYDIYFIIWAFPVVCYVTDVYHILKCHIEYLVYVACSICVVIDAYQ